MSRWLGKILFVRLESMHKTAAGAFLFCALGAGYTYFCTPSSDANTALWIFPAMISGFWLIATTSDYVDQRNWRRLGRRPQPHRPVRIIPPSDAADSQAISALIRDNSDPPG